MKKMIKISLLILVMIGVVGCGNKTGAETDTTNSPEATTETKDKGDTSLKDIIEKGELVVGLDDSFPPMGFQNADLEIVGFDIDLATEVCKRMGVKLKLQSIDWDAKEQELATKNIDCIWNGMSYNTSRDEAMTLSETYMTNRQVVVVLDASDVTTLGDLAGKTVVIQNGSTASDAMDANAEFKDSLKNLIKVNDNIQALMDLKVSGSDAVVMDEVVARYYMETEPGVYRILDEALDDENYVIGFRKGEETLCAEVEKQLKEMAADGTLAQIATEWFGKDITVIK